MRIWSPGRKMKHNPLSSPSYGKRTQPNIVNNKIHNKEMNKLLNHSPKREQARDDHFRKKVKLNIENLVALLKYQKKIRNQAKYFQDQDSDRSIGIRSPDNRDSDRHERNKSLSIEQAGGPYANATIFGRVQSHSEYKDFDKIDKDWGAKLKNKISLGALPKTISKTSTDHYKITGAHTGKLSVSHSERNLLDKIENINGIPYTTIDLQR